MKKKNSRIDQLFGWNVYRCYIKLLNITLITIEFDISKCTIKSQVSII